MHQGQKWGFPPWWGFPMCVPAHPRGSQKSTIRTTLTTEKVEIPPSRCRMRLQGRRGVSTPDAKNARCRSAGFWGAVDMVKAKDGAKAVHKTIRLSAIEGRVQTHPVGNGYPQGSVLSGYDSKTAEPRSPVRTQFPTGAPDPVGLIHGLDPVSCPLPILGTPTRDGRPFFLRSPN